MANMRPDNVNILFSANNKEVIGYEFVQSNGETISIKKGCITHQNIDPLNPARGIGLSARLLKE